MSFQLPEFGNAGALIHLTSQMLMLKKHHFYLKAKKMKLKNNKQKK